MRSEKQVLNRQQPPAFPRGQLRGDVQSRHRATFLEVPRPGAALALQIAAVLGRGRLTVLYS